MKLFAKLLFITSAAVVATTAIAQQKAVEDYNQLYANQILAQHQNVIGLLDKDGDGMCSSKEFMSANQSLFEAIDANKDGQLTEEEMMQFQKNQMNQFQKNQKNG